MTGRSSYSTGLDTLYFSAPVTEDVALLLTLNGNTFQGIAGLKEGEDYVYDAGTATVTLKAAYLNSLYEKAADYGTMAALTLQFSAGADWTEKLVKFAAPAFGTASGTTAGITVPADYNGAEIRRISALAGANATGPNSSWWAYLQNGGSFTLDYGNGTLTLTESFFNECAQGPVQLVIECYDGQFVELWLDNAGGVVTAEEKGLSRSVFVQALYQAAGAPAAEGWASFGDLSWNAWCRPAFTWAENLGIVKGYPGGSAGLGDSLTREQAAVMLWRWAESPESAAALELIAGENVSAYAETAVCWAVDNGILQRGSDGRLDLQSELTRAEADAMIAPRKEMRLSPLSTARRRQGGGKRGWGYSEKMFSYFGGC